MNNKEYQRFVNEMVTTYEAGKNANSSPLPYSLKVYVGDEVRYQANHTNQDKEYTVKGLKKDFDLIKKMNPDTVEFKYYRNHKDPGKNPMGKGTFNSSELPSTLQGVETEGAGRTKMSNKDAIRNEVIRQMEFERLKKENIQLQEALEEQEKLEQHIEELEGELIKTRSWNNRISGVMGALAQSPNIGQTLSGIAPLVQMFTGVATPSATEQPQTPPSAEQMFDEQTLQDIQNNQEEQQ